MTGIPDTDVDLFTDEALSDPYPLYQEPQALGPAVQSDSIVQRLRVERFELLESDLALNNTLRGFGTLKVRDT
jgi:hypothetical protein